MNEKYCRYCKKLKAIGDFHVRRASPDGRAYKCVECSRLDGAAYYACNPAAAKQRAAEWAAKNKTRRREIARAWDARHIDAKRLWNREYAKRVRSQNPELARLKGRVAAHARRMREPKLPMSAAYLSDLLMRAGGVCVYCGDEAPLTIDHMRPVSRGGRNNNSNLLPCCKSCNSSKQASAVDDWLFKNHGLPGLARTIAFLERRSDWREIAAMAARGIAIREIR